MFYRELDGKKWQYDNELSSETETRDFMYGLVRLLKPQLVVETGCYLGEMSYSIGKALLDNGNGLLKTCDINPDMTQKTFECCHSLGTVDIYEMEAVDMLEHSPNVDLAYIDGSAFRSAEMAALRLAPVAYVVLHDADNLAYLPPAKWWQDGECNAINFPTPLGLALFEVRQ